MQQIRRRLLLVEPRGAGRNPLSLDNGLEDHLETLLDDDYLRRNPLSLDNALEAINLKWYLNLKLQGRNPLSLDNALEGRSSQSIEWPPLSRNPLSLDNALEE